MEAVINANINLVPFQDSAKIFDIINELIKLMELGLIAPECSQSLLDFPCSLLCVPKSISNPRIRPPVNRSHHNCQACAFKDTKLNHC